MFLGYRVRDEQINPPSRFPPGSGTTELSSLGKRENYRGRHPDGENDHQDERIHSGIVAIRTNFKSQV
jgi:hypothetical protein